MSHIVGNSTLAIRLIKNKYLMSRISKKDITGLAVRYSNFPKFSTWAILANSLS